MCLERLECTVKQLQVGSVQLPAILVRTVVTVFSRPYTEKSVMMVIMITVIFAPRFEKLSQQVLAAAVRLAAVRLAAAEAQKVLVIL